MRIRVVDVEGTPEEIARVPELRELLSQRPSLMMRDGVESAARPGHLLPAEISNALNVRSPGDPLRLAMEAFLRQVRQWPDVDVRVGLSKATRTGLSNMVRLHRRGSGVGAFVYLGVIGSNLQYRLPRDEPLDGLVYAKARNVQADAPYGIAMRLSMESLTEAVRVAKLAYERTIGRGRDEEEKVEEAVALANQVKDTYATDLLSRADVLSVGVERGDHGPALVIRVNGEASDAGRDLPREFDGVPVRVVVESGPVRKLPSVEG